MSYIPVNDAIRMIEDYLGYRFIKPESLYGLDAQALAEKIQTHRDEEIAMLYEQIDEQENKLFERRERIKELATIIRQLKGKVRKC